MEKADAFVMMKQVYDYVINHATEDEKKRIERAVSSSNMEEFIEILAYVNDRVINPVKH